MSPLAALWYHKIPAPSANRGPRRAGQGSGLDWERGGCPAPASASQLTLEGTCAIWKRFNDEACPEDGGHTPGGDRGRPRPSRGVRISGRPG
jgi:hypothetical protein